MVNPFLLPNALVNLASGIVALAVSYYSMRYERVTGSDFLKMLSIGFLILGIGLIAQSSVFLSYALDVGRISYRTGLVYDVTSLYLTLQILAYLLIALSYARRAPKAAAPQSGAGVVGLAIVGSSSYPLLVGTVLLEIAQSVLVVLIAFIFFQELVAFRRSRNRLSMAVLGAFSFLLVGHGGLLAAAFLTSGLVYLFAGFAQLAGFGLLLLFVLWSGRVGID